MADHPRMEIVRRAHDAFAEGESFDFFWAEDATMTAPEGWPEQGPFAGRQAIRLQFERLRSDWSKNSFADLAMVAAQGAWVVVSYKWETRGAGSGVETAFDMAAAYRIEGDLIVEAHFRWNSADALAAAGLAD